MYEVSKLMPYHQIQFCHIRRTPFLLFYSRICWRGSVYLCLFSLHCRVKCIRLSKHPVYFPKSLLSGPFFYLHSVIMSYICLNAMVPTYPLSIIHVLYSDLSISEEQKKKIEKIMKTKLKQILILCCVYTLIDGKCASNSNDGLLKFAVIQITFYSICSLLGRLLDVSGQFLLKESRYSLINSVVFPIKSFH